MADVKRGVVAKEGVKTILHRQDAPDDHRALGIDVGLALEYLRETFVHAVADIQMLLGTK